MTDTKGTKILARTFFNQLRTSGYTQNQIIGIATELIALVTTDLKDGDKAAMASATVGKGKGEDWRQAL